MVYLKLLATAFFWGGTFIAGRLVATETGPYSAAFIRFLLATALLGLLTFRRRKALPRLRWNSILPVVALGLSGVFAYNVFFFKGLRLIGASRASLIIANNPVAITLLSAMIFREKLSTLKAIGVALSVFGAIVVISGGNSGEVPAGEIGWGEVFILGCVASWAAYSIIGKVVMKDLPPLASVFFSALIGDLLLLGPALNTDLASVFAQVSLAGWISLTYLGVCGTVLGFVWYYEGIQKIGPMRASLFINFVPGFAVVQAHLILGEPITASLVLGGVLVISGVYLTNRRPALQPEINSGE